MKWALVNFRQCRSTFLFLVLFVAALMLCWNHSELSLASFWASLPWLVFLGAWEAPRTWVAGELVTASQMNQHVRDNMNILITPMTTVGALFTTNDITMVATKKLYLSTAQNTYWFEAATSIVDCYISAAHVLRVARDPNRTEVAGFDNNTGVGGQDVIGPNTNTSTPAPGCLVLYDKSATARYIWATTEGVIMTGGAAPDFDTDTGGTSL